MVIHICTKMSAQKIASTPKTLRKSLMSKIKRIRLFRKKSEPDTAGRQQQQQSRVHGQISKTNSFMSTQSSLEEMYYTAAGSRATSIEAASYSYRSSFETATDSHITLSRQASGNNRASPGLRHEPGAAVVVVVPMETGDVSSEPERNNNSIDVDVYKDYPELERGKSGENSLNDEQKSINDGTLTLPHSRIEANGETENWMHRRKKFSRQKSVAESSIMTNHSNSLPPTAQDGSTDVSHNNSSAAGVEEDDLTQDIDDFEVEELDVMEDDGLPARPRGLNLRKNALPDAIADNVMAPLAPFQMPSADLFFQRLTKMSAAQEAQSDKRKTWLASLKLRTSSGDSKSSESSTNEFEAIRKRWMDKKHYASCPFVIGTKDFEIYSTYLKGTSCDEIDSMSAAAAPNRGAPITTTDI